MFKLEDIYEGYVMPPRPDALTEVIARAQVANIYVSISFLSDGWQVFMQDSLTHRSTSCYGKSIPELIEKINEFMDRGKTDAV